jgi:hypothetical protein
MRFHTSILRTLGWVAFAVLWTAGSYSLAAQVSAPAVIHVAGWAGVVLGIYILVVLLSQLVRREPTIVIDDSGVFDRRLGVGPILWGDISSIAITSIGHQRWISVGVRNQEQYLSRVSAISAWLSRVGEKEGLSAFRLSFAGLTPGVDEAYAYLKSKLPERTGVKFHLLDR